MPSSSFYAYFVHVLRCSKEIFQTEIKPNKVFKLRYFSKNCKNFFAFFFWDPRPKSQILTPHPFPFWKFLITCIEQWTKNFCKKPVDRAGQKPVNRPVERPVNRHVDLKFAGPVEKILTGSISELDTWDFQDK